jgi:NADPH:quinone reductase-like Zn-dependent oxidoreductase
MLQMIRTSLRKGKKVKFGGGGSSEKPEYLGFLNNLMESGELKPYVDKQFSFEDMVEAHRYSESGSRRGSVAISLPA